MEFDWKVFPRLFGSRGMFLGSLWEGNPLRPTDQRKARAKRHKARAEKDRKKGFRKKMAKANRK